MTRYFVLTRAHTYKTEFRGVGRVSFRKETIYPVDLEHVATTLAATSLFTETDSSGRELLAKGANPTAKRTKPLSYNRIGGGRGTDLPDDVRAEIFDVPAGRAVVSGTANRELITEPVGDRQPRPPVSRKARGNATVTSTGVPAATPGRKPGRKPGRRSARNKP